MATEETKVCSGCNKEKPLSEFHKRGGIYKITQNCVDKQCFI